MTIIAAMAAEDHVVMGCDTAADYRGTAIYRADGKIAQWETAQGDRVLLGAAGNAAIVPILLRRLHIGDGPADDADAQTWASALAEKITGVLADAHPAVLTPAGADAAAGVDGMLLLAWRHRLWLVHTHEALPPYPGIAAVGSGTDLALGALHTASAVGVGAYTAVEMAVALACAFDSGCSIDGRGPLLYSTAAGADARLPRS